MKAPKLPPSDEDEIINEKIVTDFDVHNCENLFDKFVM